MAPEDETPEATPEAPPPRTRTWKDHARFGFFLLFVLYVWLGPASKQLFGKSTKLFHAWDMFSSYGLNLIVGDFYEVKDGKEIPVDHLTTLGYEKRWEAPVKRRRIIGDHKFDLLIKDLCQALPRETDLRVRTKIAKIDGWKDHHQGDVNLCSKGAVRDRARRIRAKGQKKKGKKGKPQAEVKLDPKGKTSKATRKRGPQ